MAALLADGTRTVFSNARALLIIQIANQVLPLLLVPYLARTLGAELYGVVAFGLAMTAVAAVVTDYGFNLSATLHIAQHRGDPRYVDKLIGAVFVIKAFMLILVLFVIFAFATLTRRYAEHARFLLMLALPLAAQTFQPIWYFQGIERMGKLALFTLVSRIAYTFFAFIFVTTPDHYYRLALINGLAQAGVLIIAMRLMNGCGNRPAWPGFHYSKQVMLESTHFFWSRAAVTTYTSGAVMFLGLIGTTGQVAYYSAAEQLYKGAQSLFAPLAQALYPNIARTLNFDFLFTIVRWVVFVCAASLFVGVFSGHWVMTTLFGNGFAASYPVFIIFLLTLTINSPSVLLGYPFLGALGAARSANMSVFVGGAFQIVLLFCAALLALKSAVAVAIIVLVVETVVLSLRVVWGRRVYQRWLSDHKRAQR